MQANEASPIIGYLSGEASNAINPHLLMNGLIIKSLTPAV